MPHNITKKSMLKKLLTSFTVLCLLISSLPAEFSVSAGDTTIPDCHTHVFTCSECSMQLTDYNDSSHEDGQQSQSEHTHRFRCTYNGCTCTPQEAENDTFEMKHDFSSEYTIDEKPTHLTKGIESRHCLRCGARTDIHLLAPLSEQHTFPQDYTVDIEPTCCAPGSKSRECLTEGCGGIDTQEIPPTGNHNFPAEYTVDVEPTCCTPGSQSRHCLTEGCTAIDTQVIPATEMHDFSTEYTVDEEPTCCTPGSKSRHCLKEGCTATTDVEDIPATEMHDFSTEYTVDEEPTCCTPGSKSRHCLTEDCTATTDNKEIAPKEHNYSTEYTVDIEPTDDQPGSKSRHCLTEGCTARTDITPIPANIAVIPKCHEHKFTCSCGLTLTDYNNMSDEAKQASIVSHNHDFHCTYEGCNCTPQEDENGTFMMEHEYSTTFTLDEKPTTYNKGVKSRHCIRCGARTDITEIPPLSPPYANLPKSVIIKPPESYDYNSFQLTLYQDSVVGSNGSTLECRTNNGGKIIIMINKSRSDILNSFIKNKITATMKNNKVDENSSVKITLSNISENKGENIFSNGYNQPKDANYQESSEDTQEKSNLISFKNDAPSQSSNSSKSSEELQNLIDTLIDTHASLGNEYNKEEGTDSVKVENQGKEVIPNKPENEANKSILPGNTSVVNSGNYFIVGNSGKVINLNSLATPAYQLDFELKFEATGTELTEFNEKIPVTIKLSEETRKTLGNNVTSMVFNNHNDELSAVDSSYDPEKGEVTMNIDKCSPFEILLYKSDDLFLSDSEAVLKLTKTVKTGQSFTACISGFTEGDSCVGFSANENIATLDSNGVITGVSEGKTKITYYVIRGSKNYKYVIDLTVKNSTGRSMSIRPDKLMTDPDGALVFNIYKAVKLGKRTRITLVKRAPGVTVTYSSSDESIASVSSRGYVKGLKKGFATITAEVVSGEDRMVYALLVRVSDGTKDKEIKKYLRK